MEVEIPSDGCFIASGSNTFQHYLNNQRITYYLYDGKLVRGSSSNYNNLPTGYHCLSTGDVVYKPEVTVYFPFMAFALIAFAGILLFNLVIKRLWSSSR